MKKYGKNILNFVLEHKTMSKNALSKLLYNTFSDFSSEDSARSYIRRITGNAGYKNSTTKIPDTFGKLIEEAPDVPVGNYQIPTNIKHLGIIADVHSVFFDKEATFTALEHLKKKGVDALLINGDLIDFYQLSKFIKQPNKAHFTAERQWALTMLQILQKEFNTVYYKKGNHENRLEHYMQRNAPAVYDDELTTLEHILYYEGSTTNYIHNLQLIEFGKLRIAHGHEISGGGSINITRNKFLKSYTNILFAHHHQTQESYIKDLDGNYQGAWATGCLCQMRPSYAPYNQWTHGFAEVERLDNKGGFRVYNHKIINGKIL